MKLSRRTFIKGAGASAALLGLSACKRDLSNENVVSMYLSNPVSIDPYNCQEDQGTQVCMQLFSQLARYDFQTEQIVPYAASSWEVNSEATVFTFHLREGAIFHNGDPVNAQSFKRGWERLVDPNTNPDSPSTVSYHLSMVEGYDALQAGETNDLSGVICQDDYTLEVRLVNSFADFPFVTCHPALSPIPEVALDNFQVYFKAPIGNGPFMMDGTWVDGQHINLVRFDNWFGELPQVEYINFNIQKDIETAYREFLAGNVNITTVPVAQVKEAEERFGVSLDGYTITPEHQVVDGEEPSTYYIVLNTNEEPFNDINLRTAISLAINRESICENIFLGTRSPADNIVPPKIQGYQEGAWKYSKYDKAAALKILDKYFPKDANGSRGIKFKLSFNAEGGHKAIMEQVQADLAEVGIEAELDQVEWAALLSRYNSFDFDAGRLGWTADYPIMDNFLFPLFYTDNGDNRSGFSNPELDAKIMSARGIIDTDERISILQEINREIGEELPVIPIFFYNLSSVGDSKIQYAYMSPQKCLNFATLRLNA